MAEASKAYVDATSLTVKFLVAKNDRMAKELQEAKKRSEQPAGSTMIEMKKEIVVETSTLEATMQIVYNICHRPQSDCPSLQFHQQCVQIAQTLKGIHTSIVHM